MPSRRFAAKIASSAIMLWATSSIALPLSGGEASTAEVRQTSSKKPSIITYDPATFLSAMQEARGTLAIEHGCVVLHGDGPTRLLIWRRPAQVRGDGEYRVEQMGRVARIGQSVLLTGTGGKWASDTFARRQGVPASCRPFDVFSVNGILRAEP